MSLELNIFYVFYASILLGAVGLLLSSACFFRQRKSLELTNFLSGKVEDLENSLSLNEEKLEAAAQRAVEQARRIAWLETRVRQPRFAKKDSAGDVIPAEKSPEAARLLNITERRHRVLHLASRGQNAESIASTLGMLTGEVELIVNLNRADYAQFA